MNQPQKVLVQVDVLPEVFRKVLEAKQLIATRQAKNSTDACRMVDLSRSAFYKYKDYMPLEQVAAVTVTIRIDRKTTDLTALFDQLSEEPGVIEFRKI